jgi:thioredoxin reductase (NADPH)
MFVMDTWDVIIVGAGSAGCAAAIYTVRSGLKTLILDEKFAGGNIADAPVIVNYPGFSSIGGAELAQKMVDHARSLGANIHDVEAVTTLNLNGESKTVTTAVDTYPAKAVIIATGSHYKEVGVKGEKEFRGRGVSYCGVCDGPFFKGKHVMVVGGGNSACTTSLYLSGLAADVTIVHRRDRFRAEDSLAKELSGKDNVKIMWNTKIEEINGDRQVKTVALKDVNTGQITDVEVNAVFVQVGEAPNSQLAAETGVEVDENGYIKIDNHQCTNLGGVFAAGDVTTHPVKQVGTAVGQGITAGLEAYSFVKRPYYKK